MNKEMCSDERLALCIAANVGAFDHMSFIRLARFVNQMQGDCCLPQERQQKIRPEAVIGPIISVIVINGRIFSSHRFPRV